MRREVAINVSLLLPDKKSILFRAGDRKGKENGHKLDGILSHALEILDDQSVPSALIEDITVEEFGAVYPGEGGNDLDTPLEKIIPRAGSLALFAFTLGSQVSETIEGLFGRDDFVLGYVLDTGASMACEAAVEVLEKNYSDHLGRHGVSSPKTKVLGYSPGYCGWHVGGQRKLFKKLKPEAIGISLNDCFLMTPLKSVTGVLVAGDAEIHQFKVDFHFCRHCRDHSCKERMKRIKHIQGD